MSKEELEKLEREKYVVERKLTAAMHKEKRLHLSRRGRLCRRYRPLPAGAGADQQRNRYPCRRRGAGCMRHPTLL